MTTSAFDDGAIGERHPGHVAVLLEADAPVTGVNHVGGQGVGQDLDEIGAVHPEGRVPARGIRHLDRGDRRSVVAEISGLGADPGAPFLHRRPQSDPLQMAHAVRGQEHAGPDLAERRGLLVDRHRRPCAISALAANKPPIPPPTITTLSGPAPSYLLGSCSPPRRCILSSRKLHAAGSQKTRRESRAKHGRLARKRGVAEGRERLTRQMWRADADRAHARTARAHPGTSAAPPAFISHRFLANLPCLGPALAPGLFWLAAACNLREDGMHRIGGGHEPRR